MKRSRDATIEWTSESESGSSIRLAYVVGSSGWERTSCDSVRAETSLVWSVEARVEGGLVTRVSLVTYGAAGKQLVSHVNVKALPYARSLAESIILVESSIDATADT